MPRCVAGQEGQAAPLLLVALVALALTAMALVQGGRVGLLSAEAATGADAAVLAAADVVAEDLEGGPGIVYLLTGSVPDTTRARASTAATTYGTRNDVAVTSADVAGDGRTRVTIGVATRTDNQLGRPALTSEMRTFRADADAAAEIELTLLGPGDRGCISAADVTALGSSLGASSGLVNCGGADTRNLNPAMKQALVEVENSMDAPIRFNSAFRTLEEQIDLYRKLNPIGAAVAYPGTSYHEVGLAVDVGNHAAVVAALDADAGLKLCQPLPDNDAVHFSHADFGECGGPNARPPATVRIESSEPLLIDPEDR